MHPTARRSFALLGLLLFASLAGSGRFGVPIARAQVPQDTFVGKLQGLNASIAIVSDGSGIVAYVCDGAGDTISADFSGTMDQAQNGALTLQADDGTILTINADASTLPALLVADGQITGSVLTADGQLYGFSTQAAIPPAGLYRADEQTFADGTVAEGWWVRLNEGTIMGRLQDSPPGSLMPTAAQTCIASGGEPVQTSLAGLNVVACDRSRPPGAPMPTQVIVNPFDPNDPAAQTCIASGGQPGFLGMGCDYSATAELGNQAQVNSAPLFAALTPQGGSVPVPGTATQANSAPLMLQVMPLTAAQIPAHVGH